MQRKKIPLLSALPSVLHSNCSTKLSNSFSVTRSPGPFLTDNSPSFVTFHFDAIRFGSAALIFQPSRSLPVKRGFVLYDRSLTERTCTGLFPSVVNFTGGWPGFLVT